MQQTRDAGVTGTGGTDPKLEKLMMLTTSVDSNYGSATTELSYGSKGGKESRDGQQPPSSLSPDHGSLDQHQPSSSTGFESEVSNMSTKRELMRHYLRQLRSMVPKSDSAGAGGGTIGALKHVIQQMATPQQLQVKGGRPGCGAMGPPAATDPIFVSETETDFSDFSISTAGSTSCCLVVAPADYTILYASSYMTSLMGYPQDFLDTQNYLKFVHPQDVPMVTGALLSLLSAAAASPAVAPPKQANLFFRMRAFKELKKGYSLDGSSCTYLPFYGKAHVVTGDNYPQQTGVSDNALTSDSCADAGEAMDSKQPQDMTVTDSAKKDLPEVDEKSGRKDITPPSGIKNLNDFAKTGDFTNQHTDSIGTSSSHSKQQSVVSGLINRDGPEPSTTEQSGMMDVSEDRNYKAHADSNLPNTHKSPLACSVKCDATETPPQSSPNDSEGSWLENVDDHEFMSSCLGNIKQGGGDAVAAAALAASQRSLLCRGGGAGGSSSGGDGSSSWITLPGAGRKEERHIVIECSPIQSAYTQSGATVPRTFSMRHTVHCKYDNIEPSCIALLGYMPSELLGKSIFDHFHTSDLPMLYNVYKQVVLAPGRMVRCQPYMFRIKNGDSIMVDTEWSSYVNPWTGNLDFVICKHTVIEGPKNTDIFAERPGGVKSPQHETGEANKYRDRITALLLHQHKDSNKSESEKNELATTVTREEEHSSSSEVKHAESEKIAGGGGGVGGDSDGSGQGSSSSAGLPIYDSLLTDQNINLLYNGLSYTQNIKKFLQLCGGDAVGRDASSKSGESAAAGDLEDMDMSLPLPRLQSCASSTKALVSEVEPREELMMSPQHELLPGDGGAPLFLPAPAGGPDTEEHSMEVNTLDSSSPPADDRPQPDTPVTKNPKEERYEHFSLTQERLQMHQKMQMQIYIEKMIQEKASVILTQYRSRLKRSHATSPSPEQCPPPPKKYQILESVPSPKPATASASTPANKQADLLMGCNTNFPLTAISLTGHTQTAMAPATSRLLNVHPVDTVVTKVEGSGPPRLYGYLPYPLEAAAAPLTPGAGPQQAPQPHQVGAINSLLHESSRWTTGPIRRAVQRSATRHTSNWYQRHKTSHAAAAAAAAAAADKSTTDSDSSSMSWLTGTSSSNSGDGGSKRDQAAASPSLAVGNTCKVMLDPPWLQNVLWNTDVQMRYQYPRKEVIRTMKGIRNLLRKHGNAHPSEMLKQQLQEMFQTTSGGDPTSDETADDNGCKKAVPAAGEEKAPSEGERGASLSPPCGGKAASNGSVSSGESDSNSNEKSENGSGVSSSLTVSSYRSGGEASSSFKESDDMSPSEGSGGRGGGSGKGQNFSPDYDTESGCNTHKLFVPVTKTRSLQQLPFWLENVGITDSSLNQVDDLYNYAQPVPAVPLLRQPDGVITQLQELITELHFYSEAGDLSEASSASPTRPPDTHSPVAAATTSIEQFADSVGGQLVHHVAQSDKNGGHGSSTTGDSGFKSGSSGMSSGGNGSNNATGSSASSNQSPVESGSDKKSGMSMGSSENSVSGGDSEEKEISGEENTTEKLQMEKPDIKESGKRQDGKCEAKNRAKRTIKESEKNVHQDDAIETNSSSSDGQFVRPSKSSIKVAYAENSINSDKLKTDTFSNDIGLGMKSKHKPSVVFNMGSRVYGSCGAAASSVEKVSDKDIDDYITMLFMYDNDADMSMIFD